jgi:4-hydroxybenzoate polyprenyltransferase
MSSLEPPLYVDLDGTVLSTDLLYESFLSAFKASPWVAVQCVGWLMQGRARVKEELAARATIDVTTLPYRQPVIDFLREERARGRRILLATASWTTLAESVAKHLGLFDAVIATSREVNLKGERKAERIAAEHGDRGFDYVGDSRADLAVWGRCRYAYVVEDSKRLSRLIPPGTPVKATFGDAQAEGAWRSAIRAMRPHQWAKNLLLFVPLVAAHRLYDLPSLGSSLLAFAAFCLVASSAYLLNDLLDLGADRAHPRKRLRPLASGRLSIPAGAALWAVTLGAGAALAAMLPGEFQATLAAYLLLTVAYSYGLKRAAILDVISLATLYVVRIVAGTFAIEVGISFWLLAFAMFLFYSLALVKRYAELVSLEDEGIGTAPGRGYHGHDAEVVLAIGSASAMVSALVLALYINGESANLYRHPAMLWFLCPILLYWISRIWLLAARGEMDDDPVLFAVRDAPSYFAAATGAAVIYFAT